MEKVKGEELVENGENGIEKRKKATGLFENPAAI